ncbi:MAG TPA: alpha/beta fold hydrolase [Tepidisphaeraceae bacterium]|nr:alpha/beta fold hydrolase [Tepidisphaeraceae bacterium]
MKDKKCRGCGSIKYLFLLSAWATLFIAVQSGAMTPEDRRAYREQLIKILPGVPTFDQWLAKTDELPPDFDALPRVNALPEPLQFFSGKRVENPADWSARRDEILQSEEKWDLGSLPPKAKIDQVVAVDETRGNGYLTRNVKLQFGPGGKGSIRVQVTIPDGDGPFPVLICPNLGGWGSALIRRGYISAGYAGNDAMDDAAGLGELYPDFDFAALARRAWAAQLVIDYLETLPQVDQKHIGIFGYSRDGKMVTIAAAIDTRISAVIAGSTGVGGVVPWRLGGERGFGESIESTTRAFPTWFVPRLRFFSGREDRLPIDGNLLLSLIAPRAVLLENGFNDEVTNNWAIEQTYHSAMNVYQLLGKPDALDVMHVPGFHGANDQEACIDWLDIQFGRSHRQWVNHFVYPWDYEQWRRESGEKIDIDQFAAHTSDDLLTDANHAPITSAADWEKKARGIQKSVQWMLGDEPPMMPPGQGLFGFGPRRGPTTGQSNPGQTVPNLVQWVIQRGGNSFGWLQPQAGQTASRSINFGFNVHGDLYYPKDVAPGTKLPTVIWLHGYSYSLGYMWVYHNDLHPILALVKAGYAVLAFDQTGFGSRINEAAAFYDRYPHWSQMGRMVEDTRTAVDALSKDALVDPQRIYLFGYSVGGNVALHAAAMDDRVKGVVSICGFTPMRSDSADKGMGGISRYVQEHALLPRVGFFIGKESRIPYDFNELLGVVAPRPVMVVQPTLDRDANVADVKSAVEQARKVYDLYHAGDKLSLDEPWDYNRLPEKTQDRIIAWMKTNLP